LKSLNFYSDNALMFYPRILCTDRLRGRGEVFGNGGAVAGLLSRLDDSVAIAATPEPEPLLRAGARLARDINAADRSRLATAGINVLQTVRSVERDRPALRTLACGASASADWAYLTPRRFALYVISAIERGTRWAVTMPNDHLMQQRLDRQIREFLEDLRAAGAFASVPAREAYAVICDERINDAEERGTVNILIQLAANHAGEYHSFMITHTLRDSLVRPVVINRLESSFLAYNALEREITIKLQVEEQLARVFAD